jgi:hypothetical protein
MLLNKIPVLDKGYVALVSSCNTTQVLRDLGVEFYGGEYPTSLEELGSLTVAIKCPLFVQLNLSKFNLRIINAEPSEHVDAFLPNGGQIGAPEKSTCDAIADDIARTTDALLINPLAYAHDGADRFISQVLTPVNVYTTLIVQGTFKEWCAFAYMQTKVPGPIMAYTMALQQIIDAEWK